MSDSVHLVCPACAATNRIPSNRLADAPQCGKCHKPLFAGKPLELTSDNFDKHLTGNDVALVVDFWAPWCGPCNMMAPAFAEAAAELEPRVRLAKLNTEAAQGIAARFSIRSIPTMILFRNGKEIARQSGAMRKPDILRWINEKNAAPAQAR
ncbi:MAG: thioredoxin TrxC [Woeseia sp.]